MCGVYAGMYARGSPWDLSPVIFTCNVLLTNDFSVSSIFEVCELRNIDSSHRLLILFAKLCWYLFTFFNLSCFIICRIAPLFAYVILMFTSVYNRRLNGPIYTIKGTAPNDCKDYWWTSLLFIHNFYPVHNKDKVLFNV